MKPKRKGLLVRCIFCRRDSTRSQSIEHIIPESLGNIDHTLPPGVVCDRCNNYFAREVQKPFLSSPPIAALRFEQGLANKRGRVPPIRGMLTPGPLPVDLWRLPHPDPRMAMELPSGSEELYGDFRPTTLRFIAGGDELPGDRITSRFMAKVALEALAYRLMPSPGGVEEVADHPQLDPIRAHARQGTPRT
jgi:hypothetical protein